MQVCLLRFWLRNAPLVKVIGHPISDGIVFKNELTHLPSLEAYKEGWRVSGDSGLTWWPSGAASRLVSLSNYCLWCVLFFFSVSWGRAHLARLKFLHELFITYNSMRFKKPLDIFWPQIQWKKTFRRILSFDFGCKQKALSDFLGSSSSWKRANTGKPA